MRENAIIGFDRKIELDWLDATAAQVAAGAGDREIRDYLWKLLDGEVAGDSFNSARGKTVTVLRHIWSRVPEPVLPLRERALALLPRVERRCMCLYASGRRGPAESTSVAWERSSRQSCRE